MINEQILIKQILNGEEAALRHFYMTYKKRLSNFILQKISHPDDAEEILQDTFINTLEALRDFTGKSSLYTFLCSVAKHKVIDYYRKQKIKNILFSQVSENFKPLISTLLRPDEEYSYQELKVQVEHVLSKLKPIYSSVLSLKYLEGYSVNEIAKKLGLTLKSIESLLVRARREFARQYLILYPSL